MWEIAHNVTLIAKNYSKLHRDKYIYIHWERHIDEVIWYSIIKEAVIFKTVCSGSFNPENARAEFQHGFTESERLFLEEGLTCWL